MQTELYSLSKIFTETLFRIPDYQRGYSWGDRQLKEFWSDIALLDDKRDHYTGVLTLEEVPAGIYETWGDDLWIIASKRYTPYYVVDGQQRLTTSLLLLQCILERVEPENTELNYSSATDIRRKYIFESRDKGVSRSYVFGYERDNPSYEYLKTQVFLEPSDAHSVGEQTIYTHNLSNAKTFFRERLANLTIEQIESVYAKLTQHFLYNIYVISADIDVFVAFETMNNRGKPLSHLELLKNRLIFLSTRFDVDEHEKGKLRRTVNESWKTAYHYLGRNQSRPLDDDNFLATQFVLYLGARMKNGDDADENKKRVRSLWNVRRTRDYKSYLLDRYFTSRNLQGSQESAVSLPKEPEEKEEQITITPGTVFEYAHDLKRCVETYYRLFNPEDRNFGDEIRVELSRLGRVGWRDAVPLAVAAVHTDPKDQALLQLLRRLERFAFFQAMQFQYTDEELDLVDLAIRVARADLTVEQASDKVHGYIEKRAAKLDLSSAMRWGGGRAYYGWRGLKYFLFEYEQELKRKSRSDRDKLIWEEFVSENYEKDYSTIEHVYPQKARDAYWTSRFNGYSVKERNALRNSLGNLVALSRPKNSALGNLPFPAKCSGDESTGGYQMGSYSEIEMVQETEWIPQSILNRGIRLLEFMERRWQLPLRNRAEKLASLKLSFLEDGKHADDADDELDSDETEAG
jgi:hypothetical protein